jgi:hypothetical protein
MHEYAIYAIMNLICRICKNMHSPLCWWWDVSRDGCTLPLPAARDEQGKWFIFCSLYSLLFWSKPRPAGEMLKLWRPLAACLNLNFSESCTARPGGSWGPGSGRHNFAIQVIQSRFNSTWLVLVTSSYWQWLQVSTTVCRRPPVTLTRIDSEAWAEPDWRWLRYYCDRTSTVANGVVLGSKTGKSRRARAAAAAAGHPIVTVTLPQRSK